MKKQNLLLITVVCSLGGLLFGYDTGVINGTQFYFSKYFELDAMMKGWVVSSALVGCFVGALFSGLISKAYGRKNSLILSAVLFTISAWGSGLPSFLPQSIPLLVFFRILGGLGIGIASMNAPTYIAELSPAAIRGKMVTYYQLAIVVGFFVVFLATYAIGNSGDYEYNLNQGWRLMFWSELIPCLIFLFLLFVVPKSPRWLILKGRDEEAKMILAQLHGESMAEKEFSEICLSIDKTDKPTIGELFAKGILPIVLIGSALSALQQLTGINAVLYYGADIFEKALGFGQEDVLKQQLLLAGVNLLCTFIAMGTVDKFGRKPLIYLGCIGMTIGFLMLGITLMNGQVGLVSLVGILVFIGSFALSMGPVVWVLLSEMFPNRIRSLAMSVAVAAQWGMNYVVSQSFPLIVESDANQGPFWNQSLPYFIFIGFILITLVLTYRFIPETKGKSLEEVEDFWMKR
ncbi:MFS transporter, SP family, xylose:H+ symportor [Ekhidna lutea]|uniref:MFS transporter, SP family, xylose:H+ symportor n=1 Tax=Ekhidna lutea TaxID=447679 RepID=A0A239LVY8_EKHLU|nr:sugar porter family MFS transporter [Ekhidna lutea]SNT34535.1 MFS transporter, SP family, xylose:H+ symportor [Ekhidna lutea]